MQEVRSLFLLVILLRHNIYEEIFQPHSSSIIQTEIKLIIKGASLFPVVTFSLLRLEQALLDNKSIMVS
jgi:hypothetical protein